MVLEPPTYSTFFPELINETVTKLHLLEAGLLEWNHKINVISRKDTQNLRVHHLFHALALTKVFTPTSGTTFIDVGSGGGLPGLPLAIVWSGCEFVLIDSIRKKTTVMEGLVQELGLTNVKVICCRAENYRGQADVVLGRAVTALPEFVRQTRHLVRCPPVNVGTSGIWYLKGGDFTDELKQLHYTHRVLAIADYLPLSFFETKAIVQIEIC